jgi:phosphoribosylaminoimidazolecarboxamide formyltransferase/IMP cyclohydrolase
MSTTKTIQSALISVFSKEGLEPIVRQLNSQNVTLYSGGTEDFIKNLIPVIPGRCHFIPIILAEE